MQWAKSGVTVTCKPPDAFILLSLLFFNLYRERTNALRLDETETTREEAGADISHTDQTFPLNFPLDSIVFFLGPQRAQAQNIGEH